MVRCRARWLVVLLVAVLGMMLVTGASAEPDDVPAGATGIPVFSHIFVVVLENKEAHRVLGSRQAPYLTQLANDYAVATRYYGVSHPSLPNYLAMVAGDTLGVTENCLGCFQSAPNLADQIEASGRTWRAYFQSMPRPCFVGNSRNGLYVQKHNPFIYFDSIRHDPVRCGQIVPLEQWATDLAAGDVADLVWIGPDLKDSTHDGSIAEGDRWLAATVPPILDSPAFQQDGLLVVTYDEGDTDDGCCGRERGGGRIVTVIASPLGKRGFASDIPHNHFSLLRTIEDAWGLDHLERARDLQVSNLAEFFTTP
jgi:hypothetical protein